VVAQRRSRGTRGRALLGIALGVAAAVVWGGHAVIARQAVAGQGFVPLDIAVFRYVPAALLLAPLAWRARAEIAALGWRRVLLLSATGGAFNLLLFTTALIFAPASHGGTVAPMTTPIVGALLAIPLLGERPTRGRMAALAAMAGGVLLIGWDGIAGTHPGAWRGDLILLGAGTTWAVFTLLLRRWQVAAIPATAVVSLVSAVVVLPPWLGFRVDDVLRIPAGLLLWQLFAQGVMLGAVSMFLYARAVELLGATRASTLSVMVPVTAILLAALLLGEPLGGPKLAGATLAVGGMLAAVLFTGRRGAG
jgi:drug/metabolite transporter (DMT)-like permease